MLKLQRVARFMKQERKNVILAGFTNERGTEGDNRALGARRADAGKKHGLIRCLPRRTGIIESIDGGGRIAAR